jgi:hypothetical protein
VNLPPFPVDDQTLDLLEAALNPREHGDPDATTSGVWPLLTFMSQMAGSDTGAVEEVLDDGSDGGELWRPNCDGVGMAPKSVVADPVAAALDLGRAAGWREAIAALRAAPPDPFQLEPWTEMAADFLESLAPKETP